MFNSLQPYGLQRTRTLCPPLPSRVCSDSCPLSQWCSLTIPSSAISFSCPLSFPAGSFPTSRLFASGGQSIGASASVLPVNIQGWFPLGLTGLISLQSQGHSRVCVVLSHSVMSDSLRRHGLQPARHLRPLGFSRQEYWIRWSCPLPGDPPNSGIKPRSTALQADFLLSDLLPAP